MDSENGYRDLVLRIWILDMSETWIRIQSLTTDIADPPPQLNERSALIRHRRPDFESRSTGIRAQTLIGRYLPKVHFFERQSARSALREEAPICAMLNKLNRIFFVGTFALRERDNFGNALGADSLLKKNDN